MLHPEVATRDCGDCQVYVYDDKTGERKHKGGRPMRRIMPPPCQRCPKKGPDAGVALSDRNWRAYRYYLQVKATGICPDDPIVKRNCALVRMAEDAASEQREALALVLAARTAALTATPVR